MSSPLLVKISREGKEIGTYEAKEAVRLLVYGTLKETDFYWHEGMTDWEPLPKLRASEARRQLAERALQQKQEEAIKAEQLAQEKALKDEQLAQEKAKAKIANRYRCHCCRDSFPKPMGGPEGDSDGVQVLGVIILLVAIIAGLATGLGLVGALLFGMAGLAMYWGPEISSRLPSLCPNCRSTNFSRPEKTDEQK